MSSQSTGRRSHRAGVRVIANSIIRALDGRLLGHDPAFLPREVIAHEDGRPIYKYSTDSPVRTTAGDLEALAQFAGQGAGQIQEVRPAGEAVSEIVRSARETLARLGIGPSISGPGPLVTKLSRK